MSEERIYEINQTLKA
jgi:hypothetical protein